MKTIAAAKFKEQCLSILDKLKPDGLTVTKHGKPVAVIYPINKRTSELIGCMKGRMEIAGDIFSTQLPLMTRDKKIKKSKIVPLVK